MSQSEMPKGEGPPDVLRSAHTKLARAWHHMTNLRDAWMGSVLPLGTIKAERLQDGIRYIGIWHPVPGLDERLTEYGVILGDLVHNARCALDHAICAAVQASGAKPGRHTSFPIFWQERDWLNDVESRPAERKGKSPLAGLTDSTIAVVKAAQPFHLVSGEAERAHLRTLHWMWNVDKHRQLHTAAVAASRHPDAHRAEVVEPSGTVVLIKKQMLPTQPLRAGDVVAEFVLAQLEGSEGPISHIRIGIDFNLAFPNAVGEYLPIRRLEEVLTQVGEVIEAIEASLPPGVASFR